MVGEAAESSPAVEEVRFNSPSLLVLGEGGLYERGAGGCLFVCFGSG